MFATAGTDRGRSLVIEQGAHDVFDHHAPDYLAAVLAAAGGRGVDVVIEMLANVNLDKDLGLLARDGRVVVVGNRGRVEIDPRQTMGRDAAILGMTLMNATAEDRVRIHAALDAGLANGTLTPVVGREFPLADAAAAHAAVMEPGAYGKVVLVILIRVRTRDSGLGISGREAPTGCLARRAIRRQRRACPSKRDRHARDPAGTDARGCG